MKTVATHQLETPIGALLAVVDDDGALQRLDFLRSRSRDVIETSLRVDGWEVRGDAEACREVEVQVGQYFAGDRVGFDLALAPKGTSFQRDAWRALVDIPFGETRSYAEQAAAIGRPAAVRAIGRANGANPTPVVVPCHRVIGADGSLTGYGGGLEVKRWLLDFESARERGRQLDLGRSTA